MKNKVLLIDDEVAIANALRRHLEDAGIDLEVVNSGAEGLEKIAQNNHKVILLDVLMTDIDGIAVLKEIRSNEEKYGNPNVIIITNNSSSDTKEKVQALGISAFFDKGTMSAKELIEKIQEILKDKK
ncbi:MAG: hypothetical protein KatS3mg085_521 [Candidatus Dojkabacteria bacterium]|nr:MAG: hypothetical protein KatS3mg085_521 [Candidatus Dojkabacteria bacterium]